MFEVASFSGISNDELFALVVSCFVSDEQFQQAKQHIEQACSYAEAVSQLAEWAQRKMPKYSCCLTIPNGHVLAHPPDRPAGNLSYVTFQIFDVVRAAFPPPAGTEERTEEAPETLWGMVAPVRPRRKAASRGGPDSPGRVSFVPARLGRSGQEEGWEARSRGKDLGLAYSFAPLSSGQGYQISLWHRRSGKQLASAFLWEAEREDHERAREWVEACLQLPGVFREPVDWLQAYPTLMRQQPAQQKRTKRQVLADRLEALWHGQQRQPRQAALFP